MAERSKATLFVRNVPFDADNTAFEAFFSAYGPLRHCFLVSSSTTSSSSQPEHLEHLEQDEDDKCVSVPNTPVVDQKKTKHRGFGFVQFADAVDAEKALEAIKKDKFMGRRLKAEHALKKHLRTTNSDHERREHTEHDDGRPAVSLPSTHPMHQHAGTLGRIVRIVLVGCNEVPDRKAIYKRMRRVGTVQDILIHSHNAFSVVFSSTKIASEAVQHIHGHIFKAHEMEATQLTAEECRALLLNPSEIKAHRLIVRNLPFSIEADVLRTVFSSFGPLALDEVVIPVASSSRRGKKGYAFVQLLSKEDAERALQGVNGTNIGGRTVAVDWAIPKRQYERIEKSDENARNEEEKEHDAEENGMRNEEDMEVNVDAGNVHCNDDTRNDDDSDAQVDQLHLDDADDPMKRTVFVRNLPFDCTEAQLGEAMGCFGRIESCKIVKNPSTGQGKGTAFVQYCSGASAELAIRTKPATESPMHVPDTPSSKTSMLVDEDALPGPLAIPRLSDRPLIILPALSRKEATTATSVASASYDRRHLSLIRIAPYSAHPTVYSKEEIAAHEAVLKDRLRLLKRSANLFISKTRLSIRHLPLDIDERTLKSFITSLLLSTAHSRSASQGRKTIKQVKVVRGEGGKSKGYAFVELVDHEDAVAIVKRLVAMPSKWSKLTKTRKDARPMIEFAVEKATAIAKRAARLQSTKHDNDNNAVCVDDAHSRRKQRSK